MLDEFKEVAAYLSNPLVDKPIIQKNLLTGGYKNNNLKLNGIADFLTVICRHYLYNYSGIEDNNCTEEIRNSAIMIMRVWCGFDEDVTEELNQTKIDNKKWFKEYPFAEHWLKNYHSKHLQDGPDWTEYSDEWKKKLNSSMVFAAKQNCYDTILSSALAQGQLKTYYLIMKPDDVKLTQPTRKKFLKLLAVYMLQKRFHPNQQWVLFPRQRTQNWMGINDENSRWFVEVEWKGQELFKRDTKDNRTKITVNSKFIKTFDVHLSESKPEIIPEGYVVYYDTGYGINDFLNTL